MNVNRYVNSLGLLVSLCCLSVSSHASTLIQSQNGESLVEQVYWLASSNELVIVADPSQFMHITVDRDSLFETYAMPSEVLQAASGVTVRILSFDSNDQSISDRQIFGYSQLSNMQFGIGTTIGGGNSEYVYVIVQLEVIGILGPLPGGGGGDPCCGTIDINCDGVVDLDDFEDWLDLIVNGDGGGDLNGDGCVGGGDIDFLIETFGPLLDPDPLSPAGPGVDPLAPFGPNGDCDPDPFNFWEHAPVIDLPADDIIWAIGVA